MTKATYRLAKEDLDGIVRTSAEELRKKFEHGFPKGTEIKASDDAVKIGYLELPKTIEVSYRGRIHFPQTKMNKLYRKI